MGAPFVMLANRAAAEVRWAVGRQPRRSGPARARRVRVFGAFAAALLALSVALGACAPNADQTRAEQSKAQLDGELRHARDTGLPESLLQPVVSQEQTIAAGANGDKYNWQDAASNYTLLYTQLVAIEQTAAQTLKTQTEKDLQALGAAIAASRSTGFSEVNAYQSRLDQFFQDYAAAATPADYARVDATARAQTDALNTLGPAYEKLQSFAAAIRAVQRAGYNTATAEAAREQDVQIFRDGTTPDHFKRLAGVIDGQTMQLLADQTEAMPYAGSVLLDTFQARIDDLRRFGENADALQRQHDDDARQLAAAKTLADYLTVGQVINRQMDASTDQYWRGRARYDIGELHTAIKDAAAQNPLLVYEYNSGEGVGIPEGDLAAASSADDFQRVDGEIRGMLTNLRALQDNLREMQAASAPGPGDVHQADITLMKAYGVFDGRVIVVSLREQTARVYQNGKLIYWSYVTTGRPEKPSPPGLHFVMEKVTHTEFVSGDPPGSPLWYAPTPINYGLLYADGGYFLHDAWWRVKFGPGSNLPHWDPLAFNGGSHGCINFPEANMAWLYNFMQYGDPVILY